MERVPDRTAYVALFLGDLELHVETAKSGKVPNCRPCDGHEGTTTDRGRLFGHNRQERVGCIPLLRMSKVCEGIAGVLRARGTRGLRRPSFDARSEPRPLYPHWKR